MGWSSNPDRGRMLFSSSRPVLSPTRPPKQWVPGALFLRLKRPGSETDRSPTTAQYMFMPLCRMWPSLWAKFLKVSSQIEIDARCGANCCDVRMVRRGWVGAHHTAPIIGTQVRSICPVISRAADDSFVRLPPRAHCIACVCLSLSQLGAIAASLSGARDEQQKATNQLVRFICWCN